MLYLITVIKKIPLAFLLLLSISLIWPLEIVAQQEKKGQGIQLDEETRRKFDYYFYGALNAKALGNYDQAIDLFQHCYALDSTNANVLVELGTFYNVLQEKNKALDFFRRSVAYDPDNYYYNMMLAGLSKELGLKQEVIDIYSHLSQLYPEKLDVRFELANAFAEAGEFQEAIDTLVELEKNTGINEMIALNKFRLYSMMDEKEQAFDEIKQIIEKNPSEPRYLVLMGELYMEDNQNEEAIRYLERAKAIDSEFPALVLAMVNYYEKTNNRKAAQEELQKAITGTAMDVDTKLQLLTRYLAILQQTKQELTQANTLFEALFEQYPNNTQLNLIYGNVLLLQENKEAAMEQFERFTAANPADPRGYEQILRVALPDEDLDKVVEVTTEALKHLPEEPQFYFYLGASHYQLGQHEKALQVFEEGLENSIIPNPLVESDFHGQIADLNYFLGNADEAFQSYERAFNSTRKIFPY